MQETIGVMDEVLSLYETLDMFMVLVIGLLSALIGKKIILLFPTPYKSFSIFPSPAGMSLIKHSLGGNNDVLDKLFPPMPEFIDPRFRENEPKTLVFSH
jgi:hypothetical protein